MRFIIKPPPDAWIFTPGVDAPIFLERFVLGMPGLDNTDGFAALRGWGHEASQKENDGESGRDGGSKGG